MSQFNPFESKQSGFPLTIPTAYRAWSQFVGELGCGGMQVGAVRQHKNNGTMSEETVQLALCEVYARVVRPMRYQCRIAGSPENFDQRFPGTYNARLDNLDGFWRNQFGYTHGVAIVTAFYEYVTSAQGDKTILEFKPATGQHWYVACLWSRWAEPGKQPLESFAFITDEPPAEVLAAGHDRCIIPIKRENVDAWLNPDPRNLGALFDILDDRERPYFEHRPVA